MAEGKSAQFDRIGRHRLVQFEAVKELLDAVEQQAGLQRIAAALVDRQRTDLRGAVEFARRLGVEFHDAEQTDAARANVHFAVGVAFYDLFQADLRADLHHALFDEGGNAEGTIFGLAFVYQLFVAGFEDVQVQLLSRKDDDLQWKLR